MSVPGDGGSSTHLRQNPPFSGYDSRDILPPDPYLTQVGRGTPMGEFMRRFWQPVCLSEELTDLPKAIRLRPGPNPHTRSQMGRRLATSMHSIPCCRYRNSRILRRTGT